jgi:hypothetical protein
MNIKTINYQELQCEDKNNPEKVLEYLATISSSEMIKVSDYDQYFYKVAELLTTFEGDYCGPYFHIVHFQDDNLIKARRQAVEYYRHRLASSENIKRSLSSASLGEFKHEKNSNYLLNLSIVHRDNSTGNEYEYFLSNGTEEYVHGMNYEKLIYQVLGLA